MVVVVAHVIVQREGLLKREYGRGGGCHRHCMSPLQWIKGDKVVNLHAPLLDVIIVVGVVGLLGYGLEVAGGLKGDKGQNGGPCFSAEVLDPS